MRLGLVATAAIAFVVAGLVLAGYWEHAANGRRNEAKTALLNAQQWMELFYRENQRYDRTLASVPVTDPTLFGGQFQTLSQTGAGYRLTVTASTAAYTLSAVRIATGAMAGDKCGDFHITNTGRKSVENYASGSFASPLIASRSCWE